MDIEKLIVKKNVYDQKASEYLGLYEANRGASLALQDLIKELSQDEFEKGNEND